MCGHFLAKTRNQILDIEVTTWTKAFNYRICGAILEHGPRTEVLGINYIVVTYGRECMFLRTHDRHNHQTLHGTKNVNGLVEDTPALTIEGGEHDLPDRHETQVPRLIYQSVMTVLSRAVFGDIHNHVHHTVMRIPEPLLNVLITSLLEQVLQVRLTNFKLSLGDLTGDKHFDNLTLVILDRVGVPGVEADHVWITLGFVCLFKVNPGAHDRSTGPRVVTPPRGSKGTHVRGFP